MRIFEDDAGYLAWIDGHQHGFVVNTFRKPDPRYLVLHRASCHTIRGKPARGHRWTTGDFIKACSETRAPFSRLPTSDSRLPSAASSIRAVSAGLTDRVLFRLPRLQ
jgi:hypothetical protein